MTLPVGKTCDGGIGENTDGKHAEVDALELQDQQDTTDITADLGAINDSTSWGKTFDGETEESNDGEHAEVDALKLQEQQDTTDITADLGAINDSKPVGRAFLERDTNTIPLDGACNDEIGEQTEGEHARLAVGELLEQQDITGIVADLGVIDYSIP